MYARTLGSLLCRAMMDRRVANIYLSPALVRLARGEPLVFDDISCVLPTASTNSLLDIYAAGATNGMMIQPQHHVGAGGSDDAAAAVTANQFQSAAANTVDVADLCLSFELPFQPKGTSVIELVSGGANKDVTGENCREYTQLVIERLLSDVKIRSLVAEMRAPLTTIFDSRALKLFEPFELASMWKGLDKVTTLSEFVQYTVFDHGYTATHPTAKMLLEVLADLGPEDQRAFFRFLTGSPSLPVGGLAALRPRFTVVRRLGENEQQQLPSAMTCQNFLKLPAYESKSLLKEKLMQAIYEGAGSFLFT